MEDNSNTYKPASLYEAFPVAEARRLVERSEWHYTPKHGSWLNLAESELSVLAGQCLIDVSRTSRPWVAEVTAWENSRNKKHAKADWKFTIATARVKLKRLPGNMNDLLGLAHPSQPHLPFSVLASGSSVGSAAARHPDLQARPLQSAAPVWRRTRWTLVNRDHSIPTQRPWSCVAVVVGVDDDPREVRREVRILDL